MDEQRPMAGSDGRPEAGGINGQLANAVVGLTRKYLGRGPTKARAYVRDNLVVVVLGDALTKAERSLVADGKAERVRQLRQDFQHTMKPDLVEAVERIVGRKVIAFMSDNHIDPDLACEVFVLEPDGEHEAVHPIG